KRRRRGRPAERLQQAEYRDPAWSYDFAGDRTEKSGRLRILAILDERTRECLALLVAPLTNAQGVIGALEWLFMTRGVPRFIRSDNGPEFIAQAAQTWLREQGCQTLHIEPGGP
ncbi:MAG: transposase family protein, partial [Candidatus Hydrogenedentota bacterium]